MSPRTASRLAWTCSGITIAALLGTIGLSVVTGELGTEVAFAVLFPVFLLAFAVVGALVASRHPRNAIGWIFCATGVAWACASFADAYAAYAEATGRTGSTVARLADWVNIWFYGAAIFLPITLLLLLFPGGRLPSPRWRPVLWLALAGNAGIAVVSALGPSGADADTEFLRSNPLEIEAAATILRWVGDVAWFLAAGGVLVAPIAIVLRLRRSAGDERRQLRWLASAGVVVVLTLVGGIVAATIVGWEADSTGEFLFEFFVIASLALIPLSAGIAILRYRLYDIDVVINKAVVYGLLAAAVTLIYVGIVVGMGAAVGSGGNAFLSAVAAAVVALTFQPARRWAQRQANRVVYGKRATPYQVLSGFSERVAEAYSVDDVLPRMARVIAEGTGASRTTIWLAVGSDLRPVAAWPAEPTPERTVRRVDELPDRAFEVRHRGESLGAITVAMPPREPMTPVQEQLIGHLAAQAGLVLRNVRLVEDLRDSRRRIVASQDQRAKKLERDIHDGAQQQLVALSVKLGLAERLVASDPDRAAAMLAEAKTETNEALDDLRDLARGIYPPLLADRGLTAALEAQARKSSVPVVVEPEGIGRYAQETEAAVYFSCLEALQNVAKYANATRATVRLAQANGSLTFEVADDGIGFDPATAVRGSGLQGIADRLAALGGEIAIRSAPGDGTTLAGRVPVEVGS